MKSNLYIISAPSGTGKSSLIKSLINSDTTYKSKMSISYTTRCKLSQEVNGIDYYFVSINTFKNMVNNNEFIEYTKIFGNYYGTSNKLINNLLSKDYDVFLNINWRGAQQIKQKVSHFCSIFILPPSKEELYNRLIKRGRDNKSSILQRMKYISTEIEHYKEYDYLIINNDFKTSLFELKSIISSEKLRISYQKPFLCKIINNLLDILK